MLDVMILSSKLLIKKNKAFLFTLKIWAIFETFYETCLCNLKMREYQKKKRNVHSTNRRGTTEKITEKN